MNHRLTLRTALVVLVLDQLSKQWLGQANRVLIPGVLKLTGVRNTGAAFGLFGGGQWGLAAVTAVLTLLVLLYIWRARPRGLFGLGLALIVGGALGNLVDRLLLGYVIDFIELLFVRFAIFNVADSFIVVSIIVIVLLVMLGKTLDGRPDPVEQAEQANTARN